MEQSLSALSKQRTENKDPNPSELEKQPETSANSQEMQLSTLMHSLATLSAEKSRMEALFQADKKQLKLDLSTKEKQLLELKERNRNSKTEAQLEIENIRSKLIVERHARDKDHNDNMLMVRELQKLLSDERHLKENLEMQLNDLKNQFSSTDNSERIIIKDLSNELDSLKRKLKQFESSKGNCSENYENSTAILQQLQNEMGNLKQQHSVAIKNEQKRAVNAEERNQKLSSVHEQRVANLEARLQELSKTVGSYDRLRSQDQENILKLKEKISELSSNQKNSDKIIKTSSFDVNSIIDEILDLKKLLISENSKLDDPEDISKIFTTVNPDHKDCIEDYSKLKESYDFCRTEYDSLIEVVENQKIHMKTLQEKVKTLNRNIDDQDFEIKNHKIESNNEIKAERNKRNELMSSLENEYRGKISIIEQQLQKQRDRSLQLLEEKENEIKALKTSFECFIPGTNRIEPPSEQEETKKISQLSLVLNNANSSSGSSQLGGDSYHMLHYAHELARKEVEISSLRKGKYSAETMLRQALQDKITSQEELHDKIINLEEHVDR